MIYQRDDNLIFRSLLMFLLVDTAGIVKWRFSVLKPFYFSSLQNSLNLSSFCLGSVNYTSTAEVDESNWS